jgi:radical SAM superfamily enzyme YgiQ (UPF0313 family)
MMKTALIFPRLKYPSGDAPIGIACLASSAKAHAGVIPDIIDATFFASVEEVYARLRGKNYAVAGLSVMSFMLEDAIKIADFIKQDSPDTKVVFGGPHPTVMPEQTLKNGSVDAVVIGEGEMTFVEILKAGGNFEGVKGLWHKDKNGEIIKNPQRDGFENLDSLPYPDYSNFDMTNYLSNWFQLDSVGRGFKGINIISSRGCPFQCTYCQPTLDSLFGKKIRKRSPENIVGELKALKEKYGINAFMFVDDTFVFSKKWVESICNLLISEKMGLLWAANFRADLVDEDLLALMHKAGLRKAFLGIESGSQRVLDQVFDKRITIDQVKKSVSLFKKIGVKCQGYFMLGSPTETVEEINKTIRFAVSLPIDEATFSITTPLPHTHLYNKTADTIVVDVKDFDYYKKYAFKAGDLNQEKLTILKRKAYLMFYLSPYRWRYTLTSFCTPKAIVKSLNKLRRF